MARSARSTPSSDSLTLGEARRVALAAQGFGARRPARPTLDHLRRTIHRLGLLQIDFVNVLVPAHYLVPFSRLGPYPRRQLDELVYRRREFTEQWAHEASIVPIAHWPLLHHRREAHRIRPYGFETFLAANPDYVRWVVEEVRARGPLTAADIDHPEVPRKLDHSWYSTVPRATLEAHFARGVLAVADRRENMARAYDLAERVVPAEHHGRATPRVDAQRELLLVAARAHGVATVADLADYHRLTPAEARPLVAELVSAGTLRAVHVEGWREPAYLDPDAVVPARIGAAALLSPFDPVVWTRARAARLFDFEYRIEIYVPEPKRRWGYYVLPFLLGDRLVARVDVKADRAGRRLVVPSAHLEAGANAADVADALAAELRTLAAWLDADDVAVGRRGGFARALGAAVRR